MTDEQIEYLKFIVENTKVDCFYRSDSKYLKVKRIDLEYVDRITYNGEEIEAVAILDDGEGYVSLYDCDIDSFYFSPDIMKWPK